MTEIKIIRNKSFDKRVETISINGHSGFGPVGYDIVCSSISSVSYFIGVLLDEMGYEFTSVEDDAFYQLTVDDMNSETEQIFKSFIIYAEEMQKQYPDNVKVILTFVD